MSQCQVSVLHGTTAVETPLLIGIALGELALEVALGFEAAEELFGEGHIDLQVFSGKHDGLAGEAVPETVEAGAGFAFLGFGTGRMLRIVAIGVVARVGGGPTIHPFWGIREEVLTL